MQVLRRIRPTPEQIGIIRRIQTGVSLIRGAAGSGKTSTALTALRAATGSVVNQLRNEDALPANILVLTYYNSLKGYIAAVIQDELSDYADDINIYALTFDKWAYTTLNLVGSLEIDRVEVELRRLARPFPRDTNFVLDEVNYLLGRFLPAEVNEYVTRPRTGRGNSPQMDSAIRTRLLDEVVWPFLNWKRSNGIRDFHDVALSMLAADPRTLFDVVVIDEAQDFSANQLRAVLRHSAPNATITIVTDNTQRIYPRGAAWAEAGIAIAPQRSFRLSVNYRNTREVATLAAALVSGLTLDDDSSVPNPTACSRSGEKPILLKGKYSQQLEYILSKLRTIDLDKETVGFLHLKGGGCFNFLRSTLRKNGFDFCELQGAREWPEDGPNIGLCTFHSAKGLEFDHVYMIGLAQRDASYGEEADDDRYESLRRLLAMGIGRARQTVIMGVKPTEALEVLNVVGDDVVEEVIL